MNTVGLSGSPRRPADVLDSTSARWWNPLATDVSALERSSYLGTAGGGLVRLLAPESAPSAAETAMHQSLRDMILRADFPCLGARSSFHRKSYRFGVYPDIGSAETARAACHDLYEFAHELRDPTTEFATFIATFLEPAITSETQFERLLWAHLQRMHDVDAQFFEWDRSVSSDPQNASFSFSVGARAFYVVGLHPQASRQARRFAHPAVVFNAHAQFLSLAEHGRLELLKRAIRARDTALQGSVNPTLINHGPGSPAAQYSGRAVERDWRCPLRPADGDQGATN